MVTLKSCVFGFSIAACTICVAQVDIYQSDAYSVEEMCAREAEQNDSEDYGTAYENCIDKNRDNSMYQPGDNQTDANDPSDDHTDEGGPEDQIKQEGKDVNS